MQGRGINKMPCESCAVQFSLFKRKKICSECERCYCSGCLRRGGGVMCAPCRLLSTRPLARASIVHLKVRDLQAFLHKQNVSTRGCVEKEELLSLCVSHVNSSAYRRRGGRAASRDADAGPFSALKGITTNINQIINSALDLRPPQSATERGCFNSSHGHRAATDVGPGAAGRRAGLAEKFTTTPGGEQDIVVPVPQEQIAPSASVESHRVETADCFEIEDLDDSGWEFVTRPADPLPNDSEVLLRESPPTEGRQEDVSGRESAGGCAAAGSLAAGSPQRAASALELRAPIPPRGAADDDGDADAASADERADVASLQDESLMDTPTLPEPKYKEWSSRERVSLSELSCEAELAALSARQLKVLLARNRVDARDCLERADLVERARALWRDHARHREGIDSLPLEECCKICMSAPLECVLLECGHMAACAACAARLSDCPICRRYVARVVRVFRS